MMLARIVAMALVVAGCSTEPLRFTSVPTQPAQVARDYTSRPVQAALPQPIGEQTPREREAANRAADEKLRKQLIICRGC
jgi:hypothetical protein